MSANLEDAYRLSPLQLGMLFHKLYNPKEDVYVVQSRFTLAGPLNAPALEEAWNRVVACHPALRTSFHWEKLQAPSQVVHRRVKLPVEFHDLRGREAELERFLAADRARGFDLTKPPLMRLSVLRTAPEEHVMVWTYHHLLLDGWSVSLVVGQVLALYEAGMRGERRELEPCRPYKDYISWLRRQDLGSAERFWRRELAGVSAPTPLGSPSPFPSRTGHGDRTVHLPAATTAALQALARDHQLTLDTVAQGAWALLLSHGSQEEDVLFGTVVAGRPQELPEVETIVGLCINTLPARVAVEPKAPLLPWLQRLQERQTAARQHEHSPLYEVQTWSGVPAGAPLFHSLFVFERFPAAPERTLASLELREIQRTEASSYRLSLSVTPPAEKTGEMALRVIWERLRFEEAEIALLQEHLTTLLTSFASAPSRRLSELNTPSGLGWARPSRQPSPPVRQEAAQAPRTPTEEVLAGIWSDILPRERFGLGESFFDLGGHSLSAIQAVSRIRKVFDVQVPLRTLVEEPTVAALARRIDVLLEERNARQAPLLVAAARTGGLPLSFAQQRLWFLDQLDPGSAAYNLPSAVRLTGSLHAAALEAAISAIVGRHEALRTVFGRGPDGAPVQIIRPAAPVLLPEVDLRGLPGPRMEAEARRLALQEAARPFNLARGPLLRTLRIVHSDREHDLLLNVHHIVSDGWSMGVLVQEMTALYGAFAAGRPSPLPALPIQYADFALWQRRWLAGPVLQAELDHWRERLAGAPPALDLPVDRPRPAMQTFRGGTLDFRLPERLLAKLIRFSRQGRATLFMVLLAAFQALLARLAGQEDLSVGSPIAGRTHTQTEGLIGFFVNTLVLRTRLNGWPGMTELLARVRETTIAAYAHQQVPFESLVEVLQPERDLGRTPLFQVMLALQNAPPGALEAPGLRLTPLPVDSGTAKFELTLTLGEHLGALQGAAEYNRDLFDATTIAHLVRRFEWLLEAATAEPDRSVFDLPLLAEAERQALLVEWSDTELDSAPGGLIPDLFTAQAERTPEALALVWGEERLTYGDLAARVRSLADRLRGAGVGPEIRVGVRLERSPDLVVALLAVLTAGGAYVPLDPAYPQERLDWIAQDAAVALVLEDLSPAVLPSPGDRVGGAGRGAGGEGSSLAYLIYTSGSTGRPKGVAIEHRSAAARVRWAAQAFSSEELAGVLASTSFAFDLSVFEIFVPLCLGGSVYLAANALELPSLPAAGEVTLVNTVPAAAAALPGLPASVRTVNLAGEVLRPEVAARLYDNPRVERVLNLYGPSEDTTYSTCSPVARGAGRVTIGRPLAGTRAVLLDRAFRPVPLGVVGEICLAGAGLARGYFGRPELTAERFAPDPLGSTPGGRVYRTGDLGRWLPGGEIDLLGRRDHQVKVRGFRIEPGEIEAVLERHPAVREAAVVARGEGTDRHLAGFYAPSEEGPEEVQSWLRERLPQHMVPTFLVPLAALPRTPNGKVDRRALAAETPLGQAHPEFVAPRYELEEELAALWSDLLKVERVSIHDNFFALGGHSLLATLLTTRIHSQLGVEIPIGAIFEHPDLASQSELILSELLRLSGQDLESLLKESGKS